MSNAKKMSRINAIASACMALGALLAEAPAMAMDLRQAYEAASDNDATIRASRAAAVATRERVPQAFAQLLPNLSFSSTRFKNKLESETRNFLGQPATNQYDYFSSNKTLSVRQPIYRPYQSAMLRQAEAQVQDGEAALEKDEQSLVVRVGESYFDSLLAEDQLALVLAQKAAYSTQLDAARKGLAAGTGTRTDVDEAQARLDLANAQELEARQNVIFTRKRLEVLVGQPVDVLARLNVTTFKPVAPIPDTAQAWIERAEQASPELQSLRAQVETARQEIDKARAGHLPTLDAVAQWARTQSDSVNTVNSRYDNKSVGLQLSVPLYAGGYVNSTVRQAQAGLDRAQEALEATRRDLGVRVFREFRGMNEGVLRISALEQAVRSAEQALISNRRSFEAGSRTMVDILNAEQQKTLAQRDLAQARYLYLVSRLRLQALAGEDREASLGEVNAWLTP